MRRSGGSARGDHLLAQPQVVQHRLWAGMEHSEHSPRSGRVHARWCRPRVSSRRPDLLGVNSLHDGWLKAAAAGYKPVAGTAGLL
jgi:hypothetical protein